MVEKLKLALGPIPWFLVARAGIFGAAWYTLPFAWWLAVAIFLFFSPSLRTYAFTFPFIALIGLSFFLSPTRLGVVFLFTISFFLLLGVKNLLFVDRSRAYVLFLGLFSFLMALSFFELASFDLLSRVVWPFGMALLGFFLSRPVFAPELPRPPLFSYLLMLGWFLFWQFLVLSGFLPVPPFYQALLPALVVGFFFLSLLSYSEGRLTSAVILKSVIISGFLTVILFSTISWSLLS